MSAPPATQRNVSQPSEDVGQASERYDRERDRKPLDAARSFKTPWCAKRLASIASMELWQQTDSKHLDGDNQWRWATVASVLAESYSCFDAVHVGIFQGFKSTIWRMEGTCPIHQKVHHGHNRWCLINTPGFPHTTMIECFSDGSKRLCTKLPF